jgi:predicted DNA-binding transcriptional regulator AlpA
MALLTKSDVAQLLGVSTKSVDRWVAAGLLPPPLKITARTLRWPRDTVETAIAGLKV